MKRQTIAFDLDGTLVPECGEFSCVRTKGLARLVISRSLRRDAHALLRSLIFSGNRVIIYSLSSQNAAKLKLWFWLLGIPVSRVITGQEHVKALKKRGMAHQGLKTPHVFGVDLLIDDCPRTVDAARKEGTGAVLVTNQDTDWTLKVRTACGVKRASYQAQHQKALTH
jgi:FMN phosphatase YigB (HAD superfamily)